MLKVPKKTAILLLQQSLRPLTSLRKNGLAEWRQAVMVDLGTVFGDDATPTKQFRRISWYSKLPISSDTQSHQIEAMAKGAFEEGRKAALSLLKGLLRRIECLPDDAPPAEHAPKGINVTDDYLAAMELPVDQRKPEPLNDGELGCPNKRRVFVVHGRNSAVREAMFHLLRALGLDPLEWEQVVRLTGTASPFIGDVLEAGFGAAQAVVVLMTGDDEARLIEELRRPDDKPYESELTPQPRANVLFEAGMAFGSHRDRTLLVEIGNDLRPFSDTAGRHVIRFDGSIPAREKLKNRLITAGCEVANDGRMDWHTAGDFAHTAHRAKHVPGSVRRQDEYLFENGVSWKRKHDNTFEKWAYCPTCHLALSEFPPGSDEMLACSKCNFIAPFRPSGVDSYRPNK